MAHPAISKTERARPLKLCVKIFTCIDVHMVLRISILLLFLVIFRPKAKNRNTSHDNETVNTPTDNERPAKVEHGEIAGNCAALQIRKLSFLDQNLDIFPVIQFCAFLLSSITIYKLKAEI